MISSRKTAGRVQVTLTSITPMRMRSAFVASAAAPIASGWSESVPGREFHPLKSSAFHGALLQQLSHVLAEELTDRLEVIRAENRHGAVRISLTVLPVVCPAETLVEFPLQIRHNKVRNQRFG
jgi:hypothetical protein